MVLAAFLFIPAPVRSQRVTAQKSDRNQVVHLHTALNHLTVIEVGEPVMSVAAGSPTFKVEWRENKVYIQPTEENISTNLFIWTASGRFNYELEPAGDVQQMDFAVDDPPSEPPKPQATKEPGPRPRNRRWRSCFLENPYGSINPNKARTRSRSYSET